MARGVTVGDRLRAERQRRFVGRGGELELVREAFQARETSFSVLFIHGPGGVGKTALLTAISDLCEAESIPTTRLDLRTIEPSPPAFTQALAELLGLTTNDEIAEALTSRGPAILLLDTYESAAPLDGWLRDRFLPSLPTETIVVIAGRAAPTRQWLTDPGWRELLRVISLRNLDPNDVREYLSRSDVRPELHDRILELTHGHPLAVSLLVEVMAQRAERGEPELPAGIGEARDVVGVLLERFAEDVPSPRHRRALEVCAHARYTSEGLLGAVLGEEAPELFQWLRGLSFIEEGSRGLFPHDVARDVLEADVRWRDPAGFADLHNRVRKHITQRISDSGGDFEPAADFHFLHRSNPFTAAYWDWSAIRDAYTDRLREGDAEPIVAMTKRHEGSASAEVAAHWLKRYPQGFVIFRTDERAIGFGLFLELNQISEADIAADPGAQSIWAYAQRHGPPRPGEIACASRLFIDAEAYQAPSPSLNLIPVAHIQRIFSGPNRALDVIAPWTDRDAIAPLMAYIDFHHVPEADYEVGDMHYSAFAHDWRRSGIEEWLDLMEEREIAPGWEQPPAEAEPAPVQALSQAEFSTAVTQALKDLHRDPALAKNPLLSSRVVRDRAGPDAGPDTLRELVEDAVATLRADPRDEKLERALTRTYLRPAPTQEAAADVLGLPFSTYRRHLKRGVERVAEQLWSWELYGHEN